jgi:predicted ATPase
MAFLKSISVSGFKSIEQMDLELRPFNVLIGANGAGKSNLISFFKLIYEMRRGRLQNSVGTAGGADALLFYGAKTTQELDAYLHFEDADTGFADYRVRLSPTETDSLLLRENVIAKTPIGQADYGHGAAGGTTESQLAGSIGTWRQDRSDGAQAAARAGEIILRTVEKWGIFHFHDTSANAKIRRRGYIHDDQKLHSDGSNLAAFLRGLQIGRPEVYPRIVETIRLIAPWFGDFVLEPLRANENDILLNWRDRSSDSIFGPHQLPDGALRAMALVALLLQPEDTLPSLIVVDEPELGLHPFALSAITGLLKGASHHSQVIVATQSASMVDECDPEDVVVVDREGDRGHHPDVLGHSTFRRVPDQMSADLLDEWLSEYALSELWEKNVLGGGPV